MICSPYWGAEALLPAAITRVLSRGERPISVMPLKVLVKETKGLEGWEVEG